MVRAGPFFEALRNLMGTASSQRGLPALIHRAAAGEYGPILDRLPKDGSPFAEGLYLSIACSEGSARIDASSIEPSTSGTFLGDYRVRREMAACVHWPRHTPGPHFFEPLRSSPPLLIVAGEMDHVANPDWSWAYCAALPSCRYVSVPDLGHAPFDLDDWANGGCLDELAAAFYANPTALDTTCTRTMRPPKFK